MLEVIPADVPIEGYYSEDEELTEYFRLMRALQDVPESRQIEIDSTEAYRRLKRVTESPLFGIPQTNERLFPAGEDPLYYALEKTFPNWDIPTLTATAYELALNSDQFSLVALASLSRDPVVIAAVRESVVLYAAVMLAGCAKPPQREYIWRVDPMMEKRAQCFVDTFNALFNESLPAVNASNAEAYWYACNQWTLVGRCVKIGTDLEQLPIKHYHWAIDQNDKMELVASEFWDTEIWTTEQYRERNESHLWPE